MVLHYKNAIKWSVDGFFQELLARPLPMASILLYTSDHGQSLSEGQSRNTHCSPPRLVTKSEAVVPLFVISTDDLWTAELSEAASRFRDSASHFQIVGTLLNAMGFDKSWTKANFGQSLLDGPTQKRRFLVGGSTVVDFD